jgi:predicted deacylase
VALAAFKRDSEAQPKNKKDVPMINDSDYFPKNYADSRARFSAAVEKLRPPKSSGSWKIPSRRDEDLFTDHVWLPPAKESQTLLVLTSGIHGSETYAGAAVQFMFMSEILPLIDRSRIGIFIVHAMNPYGFKHHERCTENFVNLNRNFSVSGRNFLSKSSASAGMCERFLERAQVKSLKSAFMQKMQLKDGKPWFDEVSLDELIKATSPGQFERAEDWEYGGTKLEPQSAFLVEKLQELMNGYRDIVHFDLHTGLGDRGRLHLLTDVPGKSLDKNLFSELIDPESDSQYYTFTPPETEGFYAVHGALNSAFAELSRDDQRVCSLTMEFGTLGHSLEAQLAGLNSFALAHQGQFHGFADETLKEQITRENFERSRPPESEWERQIIAAARGMFQKVVSRI